MSDELGMSMGKARNILIRKLMWQMIVETGRTSCYHCGKEMTEDNYSIEHVIPWRYSEKPSEMFFELDNISYSHHSCNSAAARRVSETGTVVNRVEKPIVHGTSYAYQKRGCRCEDCSVAYRKARLLEQERRKQNYDPEKRAMKYRTKGN